MTQSNLKDVVINKPINPNKMVSVTYKDQSGKTHTSGTLGKNIGMYENKGYKIMTVKQEGAIVFRAPSDEQVQEAYKKAAVTYYTKTGSVPKVFRDESEAPEALANSGFEGRYDTIAFKKWAGLDTSKDEKDLERELKQSQTFMRYYQTYKVDGKEYTYEELKEKEPAVYLTANSKGELAPRYDYLRWRRERHTEMNKDLGGAVAEGAGVISQSFLNIFNPGYCSNHWF